MTHSPFPPLTPLLTPWMSTLQQHPELLTRLIRKYHSPVNILCLQSFDSNARDFAAVFEEQDLPHSILFARKANKCRAFVNRAGELGIGVDTASHRELQQALEAGVPTPRLVLTAAIKEERTLRLALLNGVLIILDNEDECRLVNSLAQSLKHKARVGLRVSGFSVDDTKRYSRFGFDIDHVKAFVRKTFVNPDTPSHLEYRGLHFHLHGYETAERGAALHACLSLAEEMETRFGLRSRFIDIGGGCPVNYLESKVQWEEFDRQLQRAVKGERDPVTFNNDGLGYTLIDGNIHGSLATYPYYNETTRKTYLREVLFSRNPQKTDPQHAETAVERIRRQKIEVRLEPGRSLLDQAGVTIARVAFRKRDSRGDLLVGLEMNMTQMQSASADFLLDPFLIPRKHANPPEAVSAYLTGAYCLEGDLLLKRKIMFPQYPEVGDMVMFVNTAGYMMHFYESEAHLFDLAANLIYSGNEETPEDSHFVPDCGRGRHENERKA